MKDHQYYVYIMTNQRDTVLYTGVTRDLDRRIWEHKNKIIKGFTKRYNIDKLIYYELYDDIEQAILREKQIKAGSRQKKIELIKIMNPNFKDLAKHL
ncbi:excinuclease ABC subunit C [bacterium]|nr:excinuclease ABC subunit C [bacterium]